MEADTDEATEANIVSVIGPNIVITGRIETAGDPKQWDLQLEGRVMGDIRCATLILREGGSVVGNVYAERARVSGTVEGGVQTDDLALEATGRIAGDVAYNRIRIDTGGILQGTTQWMGAEASGRM